MGILHTLFFLPIYNIFALVSYLISGHLFWITIVIIVVAVKILLLPMIRKQNKINKIFKKIQAEVKNVNKNEKNPQKKTEQTLKIYKKYKINPFSPLLPLLIQLPLFLSLFVVAKSLQNEQLNIDFLYFGGRFFSEIDYSFVFGTDLLSSGNLIFAFIVGVSQFVVLSIIFSKNNTQNKKITDFIKYIFTGVSMVLSFTLGNVMAFYWFVSNVFSIIQDAFLLKHLDKKEDQSSNTQRE